jgi:hypothetical protein
VTTEKTPPDETSHDPRPPETPSDEAPDQLERLRELNARLRREREEAGKRREQDQRRQR